MSVTTIPTAGIADTAISTAKIADDAVTSAKTESGLITMVDKYRLTTDFTGDANPLTANVERVDTSGQGFIGSAMSISSGVYTFPSTGIYLVDFNISQSYDSSAWYGSYNILIGSTTVSQGDVSMTQAGNAATWYHSGNISTLVDVTDTSSQTVKFTIDSYNASVTTRGNTNVDLTYMTFIRLGDT